VEDSPAEEAGIQEGDVIVEFNGKSIADPANLKNVVSLTPPNSTNKLRIIRDGYSKTMNVVLQELPDNPRQVAKSGINNTKTFGLQLKIINDSLREKYDLSDEEDVLVVTNIDPKGEAYDKGIREGDIIKNVGTQRVQSIKDWNRLIEKSKKKGKVLVLIKKPSGGSRFYTLNY